MNEIIASQVAEKAVETAKNFLGKLLVPAIDEVGLLIKDNVAMWRFKNQIRIINRAKAYTEKKGLSLKSISLKLLCPLLDYSSLEEDEFLQDKWAILLGNLVDSNQNVENHVFPYILSQISKQEFQSIERTILAKSERLSNLNYDLASIRKVRELNEPSILDKIAEINREIKDRTWDSYREKSDVWNTKWKYEQELKSYKERESELTATILEPEYLDESDMKEFEIANLVRLGLLKALPQHYGYSDGRIRNDPNSDYLYADEIEIHLEREADKHLITELGELFVKACQEIR